jgi:gluconate 5-dehydrogenase
MNTPHLFQDQTPQRLFSLDGKVVLLTGGAGGIALGLAKAFAAAGARLVLADRDETVHARAAQFRDAGAAVESMTFDVTDEAAVAQAVQDTVRRCGRLDVAVANAGIIVRQHVLDLPVQEWKRVLDTDLTATFMLAQQAARHMVERGSGRIINVGSIMNHVSRPLLTAYVAAKGAVSAFTRALAADLGGTGVTANALAPGYTETPFSQAGQKDFHDFVAGWTPARRWGKPEDLCGAALLLASDAGRYINGHTLYVDGGFLAVTR